MRRSSIPLNNEVMTISACGMRLVLVFLTCWTGWGYASVDNATEASDMSVKIGAGRFLYYAYGSNLLAERLHINNPSAQRVASARLDNYRLDFDYFSPRWGGHAATIVPECGRTVWGAVWSVGNEHLDDLDRQEGVQSGVYVPIQVNVTTNDGQSLHCRSYHLKKQPPSPLPEGQIITQGHEPSEIYWQVIVHGARETELPEEYINFLETIPHNNFVGNFTIGNLRAALEDINIPITNQ